jgi:hypothetical protein
VGTGVKMIGRLWCERCRPLMLRLAIRAHNGELCVRVTDLGQSSCPRMDRSLSRYELKSLPLRSNHCGYVDQIKSCLLSALARLLPITT